MGLSLEEKKKKIWQRYNWTWNEYRENCIKARKIYYNSDAVTLVDVGKVFGVSHTVAKTMLRDGSKFIAGVLV